TGAVRLCLHTGRVSCRSLAYPLLERGDFRFGGLDRQLSLFLELGIGGLLQLLLLLRQPPLRQLQRPLPATRLTASTPTCQFRLCHGASPSQCLTCQTFDFLSS